ncbi:uncharacterized protein LOC112054514 [Bicyclus anynana]|uniref:Uncharacterized protein LOC112054514 n=1 Tax=Bicyclus anynana TaxID=110368 RepID=A0ABM3M0L1_BICAN|nr:uncharacterized protein LOC112054514 [Bicyclus anynana]
MQCCVPFCANTSDNASTSEGTGITFHKLPSDKHLHAAWLRALGIQDHHLPDPAVVCSQHLLDKDFYKAESVRHIHINAIPSTVQMCMICLHTDSKLSLMSKLKMEEAYKQLTGLSLCCGGSLQQTLCVLCAQRLINFSRFRDLSLRAHSLMTDLLEQRESITVQHMETLYYATIHLQCNLSQTTLRADHCDLYIDHTDEEEQTAAEESVVGDVAVVKNEYSTDFTSNADDSKLVHKDNDIDMSNSVSDDKYSDMSIKLEPRLVDEAIDALETEHMSRKEICIKTENVVFGCTLCFEDFVQENVYKEHMIMHLQNTACDASQVCEPRAAGSCCDSLVLDNKTDSAAVLQDRFCCCFTGQILLLFYRTDSAAVLQDRFCCCFTGQILLLFYRTDSAAVLQDRFCCCFTGQILLQFYRTDSAAVLQDRFCCCFTGQILLLCYRTDSAAVLQDRFCCCFTGQILLLFYRTDSAAVLQDRFCCCFTGQILLLFYRTDSAAVLQDRFCCCFTGQKVSGCMMTLIRLQTAIRI